MQTALILMEKQETNAKAEAVSGRKNTELEIAQLLAIARELKKNDNFQPVIICQKHSRLEAEVKNCDLPYIALRSSTNIFSHFALWRWQRRFQHLTLLGVGDNSICIARKLARMRRHSKTSAYLAFFLLPPQMPSAKDIKFISEVHVICGSEFVKKKLLAENSPVPAADASEDISIQPPGMDLTDFDMPGASYSAADGVESKNHFIFGMAQSLLPESGALLVIRAMSALWQKEDLPPWEVRMFGGGPRFEEIIAEAMNLGVASRLAILSDQPLAEVGRYCHAWLAPGRSPEELPSTLWAGAALGLPVICSQSCLHRERLRAAAEALRINGDNPQELARAMIGIMKDARLRERLGKASLALRPEIGLEAMARGIARLLPADPPEA